MCAGQVLNRVFTNMNVCGGLHGLVHFSIYNYIYQLAINYAGATEKEHRP
jgi:hypothetical protein